MVQICRNSLKRFSHGGPRKGVKWEEEQTRVALQRAGFEEQQFALWIVAKHLRVAPRNLYFRLRRHKIPYTIGPMNGPPGRQVYIPESSMPRVVEVVFRKAIRKLSHVAARILNTPL